ncbi:MAG: hypothetical protein AVDCRST_MAG79-1768, partial [uncultured Thermoleophilia bacterium]
RSCTSPRLRHPPPTRSAWSARARG